MSINLIRTDGRTGNVRVPLTMATGGFSHTKLAHEVAIATMNGGAVNAIDDLWQNPESVPILVFRFVVNETSAAGTGGGEYITVGTAIDGSTAGDNLMDGFDADAVAWYDNAYGPVGLGSTAKCIIQYMDEKNGTTDHITCQYLVDDCADFRATCYIFYVPIR